MAGVRGLTDKEIENILTACEQYRPRLLSRARLFFKYEEEYAKDCVQGAYAALFEALKGGAEIKNPEAWLYKVTFNKKDTALRDKIRRREVSFATSAEKDAAMEAAAQYTPDYADAMVTDEMVALAAAAIIASLTDGEKYLYYEHYRNGKKLTDIAAALQISESAVYVRNARLKRKILKRIQENKYFP